MVENLNIKWFDMVQSWVGIGIGPILVAYVLSISLEGVRWGHSLVNIFMMCKTSPET